MAPSLRASRERVAAGLQRQVERLTEPDEPIDRRSRLLDRKTVRGWPAVGKVSGCITDSFVPGCDEHVERLESRL